MPRKAVFFMNRFSFFGPWAKKIDCLVHLTYPFVMKKLGFALLLPLLALSSCTVIIQMKKITLDATSSSTRYFPSKAVKGVRFENFTLNDSAYSVTLLPTSGTLGDGYSLECSGNLVKDAKFSSSLSDDGILLFKTEEECQLSGGSFALTVYGTLNSIVIDGAIPCLLSTEAKSLTISVRGAASIKTVAPLALDSLNCSIDGAASFTLAGASTEASFAIDGTGTIEAKDLHSENVSATIDGAGSMSVYASVSLKAKIDGTGTIDYYGSPASVEKNVSGLGSINSK
jgi:hypothetical protein